jgi:flagellar biosynthesis protein FliR
LRELGIGLVYGLALALPVSALAWGGALIEHARGEERVHEGPFAQLYAALAAVAFVTLDGHLLALRALAASLRAVPIGVLAAPADPAALALSSAQLVGQAFATATLIALPVLVALAASELLLGVLARLGGLHFMPALGPLARPALALAVVWMGLLALLGSAHGLFSRGLADAQKLLELLR